MQLIGLVEAARGIRKLDQLPYELEHEILLIWSSYTAVLLNPIIYFCFVSEYRRGALVAWKRIFGCKLTEKDKEAIGGAIVDNKPNTYKDNLDGSRGGPGPSTNPSNHHLMSPIQEQDPMGGSKTQVSDVL